METTKECITMKYESLQRAQRLIYQTEKYTRLYHLESI